MIALRNLLTTATFQGPCSSIVIPQTLPSVCRRACACLFGLGQGGRTRVHMTFIACQRCARMRLFPLRACGIMFSSARALLSVSATGLSSADFTLLQVQVKYTLTRHCHSSENQLKLPYFRINHHGKRRLLKIKWPLDILEEQIRLLFRRFNLCTTGTVWPCEEDETSALQVALA